MTTASSVLETWIAAHPYLKDVARFEQIVEDVLAGADVSPLQCPQWENCTDGFRAGLPMLSNRALNEAVMGQAEDFLARLVSELQKTDCPDSVRNDCAVLDEEIRRLPDTAIGIIKQVAEGVPVSLEIPKKFSPGTARFLGWRAIEYAVRPWRKSLELWLAGESWGHPYCPLCGEKPAMSQLVRTQKGRERYLSCGCCRTRWNYVRLSCAFCGNHDQTGMEILEIEKEEDFRIDVCRACNGYIKTYLSEGNEQLMLSDWSTLHLDVIAADQGLKRSAHSLYEA